jgi:O-antigen/teichoic acid export membrane protein
MSLLRKLAGETAIYGFSYILSRVLYYVVFTLYLTRVFNHDTSQFGIYRDLYLYVAIILVFLTFRMETTYFRYAREDRPAVTAMSMTLLTVLSASFLVLLWIFIHPVANWLEYPQMTTHILMLGGVLFFDTMTAVPFAILRQQNRPVRFLALKLGSIFLNIILVLTIFEVLPRVASAQSWYQSYFTDDSKLYYVILSNLVSSAVTFLLMLPLMRNQLLRWDTTFLKRMLRYSWPLVIVAITGVINQYSSIAFQKYFLPDDVMTNLAKGGVYAAAASLAIILSLFTTAFNYAAEPFFFAHKDKEGSREVYADAALAFTIAGSVIMLMLLAYIDVFQYLLGSNFRQGLNVVPILLVSFLLLGIYYNFSAWYKLADQTFIGASIAIAGSVITIALNIILIPLLGVIGSAWAALACYLLMCIFSYIQGQKYFPIPYKIGRMIGWMAGALLIYFLMEWLRGFYEGHFAVVLLVNTVLVAGYMFFIYRLEGSLLKQVKSEK